tara:strand:+ start:522 stop:761 length:240 start_codon:yes stop_codon:yes gene_type:complete
MPALYLSESTIAKMLGHDTMWLTKNSDTLERQYGFPKIDPAIGKRHAPSVEQWAAVRNAPELPAVGRSKSGNRENPNAF